MENQLRQLLLDNGASLVGFAHVEGLYAKPDLGGMPEAGPFAVPEYPRAVAIAIAIPPDVIRGIAQAPTMAYFEAYHSLNRRLDELGVLCAEFIRKAGYRAYAQTVSATREYGVYRTILPHKTAALHAGLGWIGKSALLITEQYGGAQRLTSVLTDAPLSCYDGYRQPRCGGCMVGAEACPGNAISGRLWNMGDDRDIYFDALACRNAALEISAKSLGKTVTLCGKCIEICPYTRRYLRGED
jgi:epoxyqueuosine reductase QueG